MSEPSNGGGVRQRVLVRIVCAGVAVVFCTGVLAGWLDQWVLVAAAGAATALSFPILHGWRAASASIAVLCFVGGTADPPVLVASAAVSAGVLAALLRRSPPEIGWVSAAAVLASLTALGVGELAAAPPLASACLFAAVYFFVSASLELVLIALRHGGDSLAWAADGAVVEGLVWLAAAPLGLAGRSDWWDPGSGLALLAGELMLGLGVWGAYNRLRGAHGELQAVEGLPAQIVAALADVHSDARVRTATTLVRGAARRMRLTTAQSLRAEAAVALLAADRTLAEVRLRGGQAADGLRSTLRAAEEQFDGSGPRGWREHEIPVEGRLAAAVRRWISLRRGGADSLTAEQCSELMRSQSGASLDPQAVSAVRRTAEALPDSLLEVRSASTESGSLFSGRQLAALEDADGALLERSPELLVAYFEILSILAGDLNFDHNLQQSLRIIRQAVDCDQAALFLAEDGAYFLRHGIALPQRVSRIQLPLKSKLLTEPGVFADLEHFALDGVDESAAALLGGSRSMLSAALRVDGRQVGCLVLLSSRWSAFRPEQARFAQLCSGRLASVVASSSAIDRIYREAQSDPLTGLPNVRGAMRRLESEVARADRSQGLLTVLFVDIDRLKPVNDRYGHRAGDRLLVEIARRLENSMRPYDFLARVGGDEFLAILPGLSPTDVDRRVSQLKKSVACKPIPVAQGVAVNGSVSVGAAGYPCDADTADDLVAVSDQRMYIDKRNRRGEAAQAVSA